ncbi:MAG: hypothetical protein K1X72_00765 [Pyrinomonadaceae bacterium]|nr:hypothetical protein [Pyrinomonadaceae bacterium]
MKTKIILLSIILIIFPTIIFAQKQTPTEFVKSFYKFHRSRDEAFSKEEIKARQKWFTTELYELFQYELKREAEYLKENPTDKPFFGDGFPITALEECYLKGKWIKNVLKIGKTSTKKDKTFVEVSFYQPNVCGSYFIHAYKNELVKNKNSWLINDLIYLDDETMADDSRLSDDLKREKY